MRIRLPTSTSPTAAWLFTLQLVSVVPGASESPGMVTAGGRETLGGRVMGLSETPLQLSSLQTTNPSPSGTSIE
ncbi:hypothetical protein BV898_16591 [Hypsibius exemplaris]|uniref:Uncharacterized protein n=1 Tax=Hypsibius exemplaris TaxID=2072580 RepID=A0A9X6RLM7_HYPEX|nr:hypothetical protein BV898_16591 [Hypsibius exemplaris]